ncbi:hypothetical protein TSUD_386010 [Trifolium subterraneum]|uniref:Single-stranded DNA binding protein Ssb-like OB fold domain-containing protein n=1 Tax=Trifolium subterraneum TaxID=3900 RepID=A0A2Z6MDY2_TRISU|nr:hypothetical protein TSUD_386010 [Trifolium subterraneum]
MASSSSSYVQQEWNMNKPAKKEPIFTKVSKLKPGTKGHTLIAKVLSSQTIDHPNARSRNLLRTPALADCLIGDETGTIIFTAHDEQVELMKPGTTVIIRNAKIDMSKGSMRLTDDLWGEIEITDPATFAVKEDNNLSLIEHENVSAVAE